MTDRSINCAADTRSFASLELNSFLRYNMKSALQYLWIDERLRHTIQSNICIFLAYGLWNCITSLTSWRYSCLTNTNCLSWCELPRLLAADRIFPFQRQWKEEEKGRIKARKLFALREPQSLQARHQLTSITRIIHLASFSHSVRWSWVIQPDLVVLDQARNPWGFISVL